MALILVVDDEAAIRQLIRSILEPAGHSVVEAANGYIALSLLRRGGPADLIITDILMPEKEGIETIIEARREYPATRILAMSGEGTEDYLDAALKLGADAILPKPFHAIILLELVARLLA